MKEYTILEKKFKQIGILNSIHGILHWDNSTYMPNNVQAERSLQISCLSNMIRDVLSDPEILNLVESVDPHSLDQIQRSNLQLMKKNIRETQFISQDIIDKKIEISVKSGALWRIAKQKSDFSIVTDVLEEMIDITREYAKVRGEIFNLDPYDALLDIYDPGRIQQHLDVLFKELNPILHQSIKKKRSIPKNIEGIFPIDQQRQLSLKIIKDLGFDLSKGRLDVSAHPFCGGGIEDVRLTTWYSESDFTKSLYSTIHETGHGLYCQGLPKEKRYQPVGNFLSYSIHESQSLLMEKQVGLSWEFCEYVTPLINKYLNANVSTQQLYENINNVKPSLIRVESDQITYHLHIMIRYEIEKSLIKGEIKAKDLPSIWNEYYKQYLGIVPNNDSEGILQDMHWYHGYIGYFPSYSTGAIAAAQIFNKILKDIPNIKDQIKTGNFIDLVKWLRKNIHSVGSVFLNGDDLLLNVTGSKLRIEEFKKYILSC